MVGHCVLRVDCSWVLSTLSTLCLSALMKCTLYVLNLLF
jgi:hypothetical protein